MRSLMHARRRSSSRATSGCANRASPTSARAGPRHSCSAHLRVAAASLGRGAELRPAVADKPLELVGVELAGRQPQCISPCLRAKDALAERVAQPRGHDVDGLPAAGAGRRPPKGRRGLDRRAPRRRDAAAAGRAATASGRAGCACSRRPRRRLDRDRGSGTGVPRRSEASPLEAGSEAIQKPRPATVRAMLEATAILGLLAGLVGVADTVPYVRDTVRGKTRPHRGTWLIWGVLAVAACVSQRADGASWSLVLCASQAVLTAVVFALAIRHGEGGVTAFELSVMAVACAGIAGWVLAREPLVAVAC